LRLDAREKEVGIANRENMSHLLSSLAIYPFTERLGMSITEVQVLLAQARREAQNPSFKAYFPVCVMSRNLMLVDLIRRLTDAGWLGQIRVHWSEEKIAAGKVKSIGCPGVHFDSRSVVAWLI
jgi:hypothetical protein